MKILSAVYYKVVGQIDKRSLYREIVEIPNKQLVPQQQHLFPVCFSTTGLFKSTERCDEDRKRKKRIYREESHKHERG